MDNAMPYGVNAALSALIYSLSDARGDFSGSTLEDVLKNVNLDHKAELEKIINANGLGKARIADTSWQANRAGRYGSMNAMTIELDGKLFVVYRGTGDGNWIYNADSAYGHEASDMQKWAAAYFDDVMKEKYSGQEVYVTGHSQGGNNAMYVTFFSEYRNYVTNYYSFDGPGFSREMIDQAKYLNGEETYEQMRQKGYAINGHEDFVHNLGEEHTTPEDHIIFVEARMYDATATHDILSHFKEDGTLGDPHEEGAISKLTIELVSRMEDMPKEERYQLAQAVMKLVENLNPGEDRITIKMTPEEIDRLKLLVPILVEVMEQQPELLETALREAGLPVAYVDMACTIINEFNQLSPELRSEALEMIMGCITVNEGGSLGFDPSRLEGATTIKAALPLILDTLAYHPDQVMAVIAETGLDKKIAEWLKERPAVAVALVLLSPALAKLVTNIELSILLLDAIYHVVEGVVGTAKKVADFVLHVLDAVKKAIGRLAEWMKAVWNARGNRYAGENPYFKADPGLLREYARRIANVNSRLRQLDRDLDSLYWQVGLLDIWDILCANLITSESWTLNLVRNYLNDTAERLETAERQACQYMGG